MHPSAALRLAALTSALALSACVTSGKYDAAVKDADDARSELRRTTEAHRTSSRAFEQKSTEEKAKLQKALDDATVEDAKLRAELERLGTNSEVLLAQRGILSKELSESRQRLDELRRAQAAAEKRAQLYRDLALRLKQMIDAGDLSITLRDGRMVLQLPNDVLFDSGQVDLKPRGQAALRQVAVVLKTIPDRDFQVAGHTDNVPIEKSRFASNWELSAARGVEVVHFLVGQGVVPSVLAAAGYGEFDPVAPNDDAKSRARNRRIEITLQPNVHEIIAIPEPR